MAKKIEKFKDFIAWQKARKLSRKIYQATNLPIGGLRVSVEKRRFLRRSQFSLITHYSSLITHHCLCDSFMVLITLRSSAQPF